MSVQIGDKYYHWTVIGSWIRDKKSGHKKYLCQCDCSKKTQRYVDEFNLKRGFSRSCGCETIKKAVQNFTTHGQTKTRLHYTWNHMKNRCFNPNDPRYNSYGGRGITVCDEWKNSFIAFRDWALSNGYSDELSIDRRDNDGNYEPSNCRWVTNKEQCNNRRSNVKITYKNETHNLIEWERITGIKRHTLAARLKKGYPLEDVFFIGKFKPIKRS